MKLKILPVFYRITDRSKPPGYIHQTAIYDSNATRHLISQVMKLPVSKMSFFLHFGRFWLLFISGLWLLHLSLRNEEQPIFSSLWWNLGDNSQARLGGRVAWFDFTITNVSCFLQFDGNGVGCRTYHLSWHLKDKNGIINSASSLQNQASVSKWRTLACSFSILLSASDVRLLITWSHLSKQALPNLSSRPATPNNTGKFMSEGSTSVESKNLIS